MNGVTLNPTCLHERPVYASPITSPTTAFDEAILIQRCKTGDGSAWNTLIHRYQNSVYKLAYALCRNHEDAGDIAGQVFLRLYQNLHTFRHESCFTSWLFRIVRNIYIDQCIRHGHHGHLSLNTIPANNGQPRSGWDIPDPAPSPETICLQS